MIYHVNKPDAANGRGHSAIIILNASGGYSYFSYFGTSTWCPFSRAVLLTIEFPTAAEALAYAKTEGYTREQHWTITPAQAAAATAVLTRSFATGTLWNVLTNNCWHAVHAALRAAGTNATGVRLSPNRNFTDNHASADAWSTL